MTDAERDAIIRLERKIDDLVEDMDERIEKVEKEWRLAIRDLTKEMSERARAIIGWGVGLFTAFGVSILAAVAIIAIDHFRTADNAEQIRVLKGVDEKQVTAFNTIQISLGRIETSIAGIDRRVERIEARVEGAHNQFRNPPNGRDR